jgi:hypothetical protein
MTLSHFQNTKAFQDEVEAVGRMSKDRPDKVISSKKVEQQSENLKLRSVQWVSLHVASYKFV